MTKVLHSPQPHSHFASSLRTTSTTTTTITATNNKQQQPLPLHAIFRPPFTTHSFLSWRLRWPFAPWTSVPQLTCAMLRMSPLIGSMVSWVCPLSLNLKSPEGLLALGIYNYVYIYICWLYNTFLHDLCVIVWIRVALLNSFRCIL